MSDRSATTFRLHDILLGDPKSSHQTLDAKQGVLADERFRVLRRVLRSHTIPELKSESGNFPTTSEPEELERAIRGTILSVHISDGAGRVGSGYDLPMDSAEDTWTVEYASKQEESEEMVSELNRLSDVGTRYVSWIDWAGSSATGPRTNPNARLTGLIQGQIDELTTELEAANKKVRRQERGPSRQDDAKRQSLDREISRLQIERGAMSEGTDESGTASISAMGLSAVLTAERDHAKKLAVAFEAAFESYKPEY